MCLNMRKHTIFTTGEKHFSQALCYFILLPIYIIVNYCTLYPSTSTSQSAFGHFGGKAVHKKHTVRSAYALCCIIKAIISTTVLKRNNKKINDGITSQEEGITSFN